jgi:hypothetical protein
LMSALWSACAWACGPAVRVVRVARPRAPRQPQTANRKPCPQALWPAGVGARLPGQDLCVRQLHRATGRSDPSPAQPHGQARDARTPRSPPAPPPPSPSLHAPSPPPGLLPRPVRRLGFVFCSVSSWRTHLFLLLLTSSYFFLPLLTSYSLPTPSRPGPPAPQHAIAAKLALDGQLAPSVTGNKPLVIRYQKDTSTVPANLGSAAGGRMSR